MRRIGKHRAMINFDAKDLGRLDERHLLIFFEGLAAAKFPNEKPRLKIKSIIGCSLPHYDNAKTGKTWIGSKAWLALERELGTSLWSQWIELKRKQ